MECGLCVDERASGKNRDAAGKDSCRVLQRQMMGCLPVDREGNPCADDHLADTRAVEEER